MWHHKHEPSGKNGDIKTKKLHGYTVLCISVEHDLWRVTDHPKMQSTYRGTELDYLLYAQITRDRYLK